MEELREEIFTREMKGLDTGLCNGKEYYYDLHLEMKVMKVISKCDELLYNTSLLILFN